MKIEPKGETIERFTNINNKNYKFIKSWHFLDNGERFYYIKVYLWPGSLMKPVHVFWWTTSPDGKEFLGWVR